MEYNYQTANGDCYFTRECEALGLPLLVTPILSFKEQGLVDGKNCYYIPFDVENINIDKIVNHIPEYEPFGYIDTWDKMLAKGKSTYIPGEHKIHARVIYEFTLQDFEELEDVVRANKFKNSNKHLYEGDTFYCDEQMYEYLTIIPGKQALIERIEDNV